MEPKIRIRGFNGEWEKVIVGNLGTTYSGLSGKSKEDFGVGDAKFVTFLNVLCNAKIDTSVLEAVNVTEGEHQNEVKKGDLLFNTSSETPDEVGMCAVMDEELDNVYLNSFCFGFRVTNQNINSTFIAYLMRSHVGRRIMSILAQGATRYNLSKNNFCNAELVLPQSKDEQQQIADYFTNLDKRIAIQSQQLEKLKQVKAASLQSMFPQEGETTPRVRFKGFEGEWEQKEMSKIGYMTAGGTPSTFNEEYWSGDINWLQSGAVQNNIIYSSSVERKITKAGLEHSAAYLIKEDSILIAITGATCANIGYLTFESSANQSVVSVETNDDYSSKFIYQSLIKSRNQILSFKGGSAQSGVTLSNLKKLIILCPSHNEQVKIGEYFYSLEIQIERLTQRLEKLKQIKSACLDNMFV